MRNLYKYLPPLLADTFGFQEVIDVTDGMGIIDDCSDYKGQAGRIGGEDYRGSRMAATNIRMEDVIGGTKEKLLDTFRRNSAWMNPAFVVISPSPVSSMIGTDMEDVAETIERESGIPTTSIDLAGHRLYDHGVSETLLALAKLLVEPTDERLAGGINILGGNAIDYTGGDLRSIRRWAEDAGFNVISQWGTHEKAENLRQAARAEINLVTAAAGLAAAKWLKKEFGTPYIAAAPFGKSWSESVAAALKGGVQPKSSGSEGGRILIVGEQLCSNAIRDTLVTELGQRGVDVGTMFIFDKSLAREGDRRLKSEDELKAMLESGYSLIIADPDMRAMKPSGCGWLDLPHGAVCYNYSGESLPVLAGEGLSRWLERSLKGLI